MLTVLHMIRIWWKETWEDEVEDKWLSRLCMQYFSVGPVEILLSETSKKKLVDASIWQKITSL